MSMAASEMVRLYVHEGLSTGEIAEQAHISKTAVWKTLKRNGIELRPQPQANKFDTITAIAAFDANARSLSKAARALGVDRRTLRRALIRGGVYEPKSIIPHLNEYNKSAHPELRQEVAQLRRDGFSKTAIASRLGINRETVDYVLYLVEHNIVPEASCQNNQQNTSITESEPSMDSIHDVSSPVLAVKIT